MVWLEEESEEGLGVGVVGKPQSSRLATREWYRCSGTEWPADSWGPGWDGCTSLLLAVAKSGLAKRYSQISLSGRGGRSLRDELLRVG